MTHNRIQIKYENEGDNLPESIEERIAAVLILLMAEMNQSERSLSLYFCSMETMSRLNGTYRKKDQPTDLLSWLYQEDETSPFIPEEPWGELVYCLEFIRDRLKTSGWELEDELLRLTVHGLVHLLGYDHESDTEEAEMLGMENKLLKRIGMVGVYPA
jgi:probable rRNA maturation factor